MNSILFDMAHLMVGESMSDRDSAHTTINQWGTTIRAVTGEDRRYLHKNGLVTRLPDKPTSRGSTIKPENEHIRYRLSMLQPGAFVIITDISLGRRKMVRKLANSLPFIVYIRWLGNDRVKVIREAQE